MATTIRDHLDDLYSESVGWVEDAIKTEGPKWTSIMGCYGELCIALELDFGFSATPELAAFMHWLIEVCLTPEGKGRSLYGYSQIMMKQTVEAERATLGGPS